VYLKIYNYHCLNQFFVTSYASFLLKKFTICYQLYLYIKKTCYFICSCCILCRIRDNFILQSRVQLMIRFLLHSLINIATKKGDEFHGTLCRCWRIDDACGRFSFQEIRGMPGISNEGRLLYEQCLLCGDRSMSSRRCRACLISLSVSLSLSVLLGSRVGP